MHAVGGEAHLVEERDEETRFDALLEAPLDPAIRSRIEKLRRHSERYLDHVLG